MNIYHRIYRRPYGLVVKVFSDNSWPWYCVFRVIKNRKEALVAIKAITKSIKEHYTLTDQ